MGRTGNLLACPGLMNGSVPLGKLVGRGSWRGIASSIALSPAGRMASSGIALESHCSARHHPCSLLLGWATASSRLASSAGTGQRHHPDAITFWQVAVGRRRQVTVCSRPRLPRPRSDSLPSESSNVVMAPRSGSVTI